MQKDSICCFGHAGKADSATSGKNKEHQRTKKVSKNKDEVTFKKQDAELTVPKKKASSHESQKSAGLESTPKRRGKSKVKEFIRIFSQETSSKPRTPNSPSSRGSRREEEPTPTVEAATQQEKSKKSNADDEKIKISKNVEVPKEADGLKPRTTNNPSSRSTGQKEPAATMEAAPQQEKRQRSEIDDEKSNIFKTVELSKKDPDASDKVP